MKNDEKKAGLDLHAKRPFAAQEDGVSRVVREKLSLGAGDYFATAHVAWLGKMVEERDLLLAGLA